jgi:predicted transcriptional regulator
MNDPQIIRSPSGDELVVVPRAEYEALVAAATAKQRDRMTREGMADVAAGRVVDHATALSRAIGFHEKHRRD